ncbi:MAG: hypothetical protein LUH11_03360, partial [Candidatus Gastranaerophilales bacterium]|nr:hypothetical protein [Candidatus Gastranaerophilales bacterium]
ILTDKIKNLFNLIFIEGIIYRSSGIYAGCLTDDKKAQLELFCQNDNKKEKRISLIIDKLEYKYGKGVISLGRTGIKSIQEKHKREMQLRSF